MGIISVCNMVEGFYKDTLPKVNPSEQYALIFEDADLPASVLDVLEHMWPRLAVGGIFFSHEAHDLEVTRLFFDETWWRNVLNVKYPGLVGAGTGLPLIWHLTHYNGLCSLGSCLAYTVKETPCGEAFHAVAPHTRRDQSCEREQV